VTHLGLYDFSHESVYIPGSSWTVVPADGFNSAHPVGLWRLSDATLLTSGTIPAGTDATLIDRFRYVEVPEVTLDPGDNYVIGFYTASNLTSDPVAADPDKVTWNTDPIIHYVSALTGSSSSGLTLPSQPLSGDLRFGPSFQFTVVPAPAAAFLALIGLGSAGGWLRRRRTR